MIWMDNVYIWMQANAILIARGLIVRRNYNATYNEYGEAQYVEG